MSVVSIEGSDATFDCDEKDTLLRAALRQGVPLSYECNSGSCGSCKVRVLEGETYSPFPDSPGLTERDVEQGVVLACQSHCRSSHLSIKANMQADQEAVLKPTRFTITLQRRQDIAQNLAEFEFEMNEDLHYPPGSYFMVDIPGVGERAYSASSIDSGNRCLRFVIKRMPGGKGSGAIFSSANAGDSFSCDGPYGHAYFRDEVDRDVTLIAGGSGLSPMMSIIRHLSEGYRANRRVRFFYGAKSQAELNEGYIRDAARAIGPQFTLVSGLSGNVEELGDWQGETGFIHEVLDRSMQDYDGQEFYLCGPPPMALAVQKHLMIKRKVPFDRIHFDRFY